MKELIHVPADDSWFTERKEEYLNSSDFKEFEAISGLNLKNLASVVPDVRKQAQDEFCRQSSLMNTVRTTIGDYFCPLVYTQEFGIAKPAPEHNMELDKKILSLDMNDSLRRRHLAISYALLPPLIIDLREKLDRPIVIKNLGSGMGIDCINAILELREQDNAEYFVDKVINYDLDNELLDYGRNITANLEKSKSIPEGMFTYGNKNLYMSRDKSDMVLLIGYICGTTAEFATDTLRLVGGSIKEGGKLVVSSSNYNMKCTDPLANFLIQHLGLVGNDSYPDDPMFGWPLNFRTKDQMVKILEDAGYKEIQVYDDANFPGREGIEDKIMGEVDCLPSLALGLKHDTYKPMILPSKEILDKRLGYNWIAIATKNTKGGLNNGRDDTGT